MQLSYLLNIVYSYQLHSSLHQITNYLRCCSFLGIAERPDFSATPLPVVPCTVTQGEHTAGWAHPTEAHQQPTHQLSHTDSQQMG